MIYRDYHGVTLLEAINDVYALIDKTRMNGKGEDAEIVTGFGKIRSEVFNELKRYGLHPTYKLGNDGTILCYIE